MSITAVSLSCLTDYSRDLCHCTMNKLSGQEQKADSVSVMTANEHSRVRTCLVCVFAGMLARM